MPRPAPIDPRPAGAPLNAAALAEARSASTALGWPKLPGCRVLVVPHHDAAAALIVAGLTAAMGATGATTAMSPLPPLPSRIVLIGVDHARESRTTAATSVRAWRLPSRTVTPDGATVAALIASRAASEDGEGLSREHSIAGVLPFVAEAAPRAVIVPLAVRPNAPSAAVEALADAIGPPDRRTLVVAAVDFAHGLSRGETAVKGREAEAVLAALDVAAVGRWGDDHADGRGALRLAMTLAGRAGATDWTTLAVTDAGALPGWAGGGVTGYVAGCWRRAAPEVDETFGGAVDPSRPIDR